MTTPKKDNPFTKARKSIKERQDKKTQRDSKLRHTSTLVNSTTINPAKLIKNADSSISIKTASPHTRAGSQIQNYFRPGFSVTKAFTEIMGSRLRGKDLAQSILPKQRYLPQTTPIYWRNTKSFDTGMAVRPVSVENSKKWSTKYNKKHKTQNDWRSNPIFLKKTKKRKVAGVFIKKPRTALWLVLKRLISYNLTTSFELTKIKKTQRLALLPRSYLTFYLNNPFKLFGGGCPHQPLSSFFSTRPASIYRTSKHLDLDFLGYLKFVRSEASKSSYNPLLNANRKTYLRKLPHKDKSGLAGRARLCFWDSFYNTLPLASFVDKKVTVINYNIANVIFEKDFTQLLKRALKYFPFMQLNRVAARLIGSIFSILVLKDSKALSTFIQTIMQKEHYKKHNMFFGFAGQLVTDVFSPWLHYFNCLGVSVTFRGKLAVGGNSRKRALKYKTGMLSSSSKYIKINRTFAIVRTKTGSVGFVVTVAW